MQYLKAYHLVKEPKQQHLLYNIASNSHPIPFHLLLAFFLWMLLFYLMHFMQQIHFRFLLQHLILPSLECLDNEFWINQISRNLPSWKIDRWDWLELQILLLRLLRDQAWESVLIWSKPFLFQDKQLPIIVHLYLFNPYLFYINWYLLTKQKCDFIY